MEVAQEGEKQSGRETGVLLCLLALASVLLALGLSLPLITIKTLVVMQNSFSVLSGIADLWSGERYLLSVLVGLFSLVLPIAKLIFLSVFLLDRGRHSGRKLLALIHDYGRWAMLDVLVVAVLIVTVKLGAVASVEVHPGLYVFTAAVLLIMLITHRVARRANS